MAPKKPGDVENPQGLNTNELRFIKAVFDNMTQKPDANWDRVAGDLGLKDAKCAKERFRQMSVRHGWREQPSPVKGKAGVAGGTGVAKKQRTTRKKVKKEGSGDGAEGKEADAAMKSEDDEL